MRSHATKRVVHDSAMAMEFQYRKRYEVTCDITANGVLVIDDGFQYRKRYEVTCDREECDYYIRHFRVSIPQAV